MRERYDVYVVGPPSKWGNLLVVGREGTREQVIERFERRLLDQPRPLAELVELDGNARVLGRPQHVPRRRARPTR
jgi:uncharacterized protein DUF4326